MGCIDVSRLPLAEYLALELAPPLRVHHLACLCRAVEACFASKSRREGSACGSRLACCRIAGCAAASEDREQGII